MGKIKKEQKIFEEPNTTQVFRHWRFSGSLLLVVIVLHVFAPVRVSAEDKSRGFEIQLGDEFTKFNRGKGAPATPSYPSKKGNHAQSNDEEESTGHAVLMYLPRRIMDFLDIFRFDIGVGVAWGGVVRVTRPLQAGERTFDPASYRLGLRGRESPFFIERHDEEGFGPWYHASQDRAVTPAEVGAGLDLGCVSAYAGVSLDELGDFLAGLVGFDPKDDDWK